MQDRVSLIGATFAACLFLSIRCSSEIQEAKSFAATTDKNGAEFLQELAEICGKGYVVSHSLSEASRTANGWRLKSDFYVRPDAKVRSIVEATQTTRWYISDFMECMFVASEKENISGIEATVTFRALDDPLNPLPLGKYRLERSKLEELSDWKQKPSFFDRNRVSQYIEANMTTDLEDWSEMKLE